MIRIDGLGALPGENGFPSTCMLESGEPLTMGMPVDAPARSMPGIARVCSTMRRYASITAASSR
jgi:hypothetical protein